MTLKQDAMYALDTQLGLITFMKSETGRHFMRGYMSDVYAQAPSQGPERIAEVKRQLAEDPELSKVAAVSGETLAANICSCLNEAQTYVITDDMFSLALKAGETVPHTPFQPDDLPTEHGFVLLPRPLITQDVHGLEMSARAFGRIRC